LWLVDQVHLRPFAREQLPLIESWFTDVETERWLGGPNWPRRELDIAEQPLRRFRGARETGRVLRLAWDHAVPVGYIGCESFDRWTNWAGRSEGVGAVKTIDVPTGWIGYVVDPALRRRGYATVMIQLLIDLPGLDDVKMFTAGVDPANVASVRALAKAGFRPLVPEPDVEGIVYFVWQRGTEPVH
jgi:RimJ/RimL family protein N-acetyltransferase